MKTRQFWYPLPERLIAQHPAERRGTERMMVLHRDTCVLEHRHIADIVDYLDDRIANSKDDNMKKLAEDLKAYHVYAKHYFAVRDDGALLFIRKKRGLGAGLFNGPGGRLEPAGIVHRGEYVVPQPQMRDPEVARMVAAIETKRRRTS